ncbi:MAG: shikimate kinase [Flavobacteriales endosymbiont of Rhyzopertha dominica]
MGCGKSNIGNILSSIIKLKFYDLDELISLIYKMSINDIYNKYGKIKFREIETFILNYFLIKNKYKSYILSVGGGTPCYFNNIYLMNKYSNTIYLKTNINIIYDKLLEKNNKIKRPIIKNLCSYDLLNFIKNHINKRKKYYLKSKFIINIKNMSFLEIVYYIIDNIIYV